MQHILTVTLKELTDTLRDRRTMMVTLLTSIAAGPLFLILILNMAANQAERGRELKLPVQGADHAPALVAFLERQQIVVQPRAAGLRDQDPQRRPRRCTGDRRDLRDRCRGGEGGDRASGLRSLARPGTRVDRGGRGRTSGLQPAVGNAAAAIARHRAAGCTAAGGRGYRPGHAATVGRADPVPSRVSTGCSPR